MKKTIILLLSLFAFISNVYALEVCTPTDEYLNYISLSEEERKNYYEPITCKEMEEENDTYKEINKKVYNFINDLGAPTYPSSYNAVDDGIVANIKNQYDDGTCWAFSSLSVVETNAKKNDLPLYNLSEAHMVYSLIGGAFSDTAGKYNRYNTGIDGGRVTYAATYFFGGYGTMLESDMPYTSPHLPKISSSNYVAGTQRFTVDNFELYELTEPTACSASNIKNIKKLIMENGSVQGTMYYDNDPNTPYMKNGVYYKARSSTSYTNNHGITIVGWDDSIPASSFNNASRDGAWIIKNSWGTNWGNHGFFYISYDDEYICQQYTSFYGVNDTTYDYIHQSSELVGSTIIGFEGTIYIATRLTAEDVLSEEVHKISFATPDYGDYTVYMAPIKDLKYENKWTTLGSGTSRALGISSIYTDQVIEEDVYIIVKYSSPSNMYLLFTTNESDTSMISFQEDMNFIAASPTYWEDLTVDSDGTNKKFEPNIYIYADKIPYNESSIKCTSVDDLGERYRLNLSNPDNLNISNVKIYLNGADVTSSFDITVGNNITINNRSKLLGRAKVLIYDQYGNISVKFVDIKLRIEVPSLYTINSSTSTISVPAETSVSSFKNNVTVYNANYRLLNNNSVVVNSGNLGTGYALTVDDKIYYFIIKGDANGDSYIDSGDLLRMVKHLKKSVTLSDPELQAIELNNDNVIDSGDLLKMVKYLNGKLTSL